MIHRGIYGALAALFFLSSCVSPSPVRQPPPEPARRHLLRIEPEITPDWKDTVPKSGTELFFVGVSRSYDTAADARGDARNDAFTQVMLFYGEFIQSAARENNRLTGTSGGTIAAYVSREETISSFAQAVVSQVGTDRYYTEVHLNEKNKEEYTVYVLCQIPRQKAEDDIRSFAEKTSAHYNGLLVPQNTLYSAMRMYGEILTALDGNPLHRTVAYYDGPNGRVSLYEYARQQINTLAASVSFGPLPVASVQKTDTLDVTVGLVSTAMPVTGPLDCSVAVYGMNNPSPTAVYSVTAESSFPLRILTQKLESGAYTARLELLLNRLSPQVTKNPEASFSFEVINPCAEIRFEGISLTTEEKAVLTQGLQQGIQRNQTPLQISAPPRNAQNRYGLEVTVRQIAGGNPELVQYDVSLAFTRNGTVVWQSEIRRVVEMGRGRAFIQAAAFIRDNIPFFQGIADTLR